MKFNEETGDFDIVTPDYDLFRSLQLAGSSYGITTEFVYRVYNTPEVRPVLVLVYVEDETDLYNFELAAFDGRYLYIVILIRRISIYIHTSKNSFFG